MDVGGVRSLDLFEAVEFPDRQIIRAGYRPQVSEHDAVEPVTQQG